MAENFDEYGSEEEQEQMPQEEKDKLLMDAVKENNYDKVNEMLQKQASPSVEKDGWNPLLWASCNGNEDIVRLLIKHNAQTSYVNMA